MTVKTRLLQLLEAHKGETLSGESLAAELQCTRAAIWKAVKALREEGYVITAGTNRGYMLSRESSPLSLEGIRAHLEHPDVYMKFYEELESTNQTAKEAVVARAAGHGSFVLARTQTAGRGRRGREFYSPKDAGLYLSVILEPKEKLRDSLLLTTAAATAVYRAVREVCEEELSIKWVNDLYCRGKKVCGILTEAITDFESGDIEAAIVGIGLNLYEEPEGYPRELSQVAGGIFEDRQAAERIDLNCLVDIEAAIVGIGLNLYEEPEGYPRELSQVAGGIFEDRQAAERIDLNCLVAAVINALLEETGNLHLSEIYGAHNLIPGRWITITDGTHSRTAQALSIYEDGRLEVQEEDGSISLLSYGEVSVLPFSY